MKYRHHLPAALAMLLIAGCDKASDGGPKSMEEAKEEAAKLERPNPGQYKQTIEITQFDIPGAPPGAADQIKQAMQQQQAGTFCLTKEKAEAGFREMFSDVGKNGECTYERFDVDGGKLDAVLNCKGADKGTARIVLAGKVTSEGSDVTVNVDQVAAGDNPMGNAKIGMHMTSQRTGDCPSGG